MESSGIWPCCKGNDHLRAAISPLPLWEEGYIPVDELWEYKTDESGARLGHQLKAERPPVESWEATSWKLRGWPNYKLLDFWGLILPPFTIIWSIDWSEDMRCHCRNDPVQVRFFLFTCGYLYQRFFFTQAVITATCQLPRWLGKWPTSKKENTHL